MKLLLISIENYNNYNNLIGVHEDANRIKTSLKKTFKLKDKDIVQLKDNKATKHDIITKIEHLLSIDNNFIMYYSGHGTQIPVLDDGIDEELDNYDEAIALANINKSNYIYNTITDNELNKIIKAYTKAKIMIILDCCHSGDFHKDIVMNPVKINKFISLFTFKGMRSKQMFPFDYNNCKNLFTFKKNIDNVIYLSACKEYESSYLTVIRSKKLSIFTYYLVQALDKGIYKLQSLYKYIKTRVNRRYKDQNPTINTKSNIKLHKFFGLMYKNMHR